jgi:hypothetical protein
LTDLCETANWVLADVVAALIALAIAPADAAAFAHYVFAVHANGPGYWPHRLLNEEQWDRLTYDGEHPGF